MTDIQSNNFSYNSTHKDNIINRHFSNNSKKMFLNIDMPNNKTVFKLPKISINKVNIVLIDKINKPSQELELFKTEDRIKHLLKIFKHNSYQKKIFITPNKNKIRPKNKISNNIFKNRKMPNLNQSNNYNKKNNSLSLNHTIIKKNPINIKKCIFVNNNNFIVNDNNDKNNYQFTDRNNEKDNKNKINKYISTLLNENNNKNNNSLDNKEEEQKLLLENSIEPKNNIKIYT